jgi:hypothetical protein
VFRHFAVDSYCIASALGGWHRCTSLSLSLSGHDKGTDEGETGARTPSQGSMYERGGLLSGDRRAGTNIPVCWLLSSLQKKSGPTILVGPERLCGQLYILRKRFFLVQKFLVAAKDPTSGLDTCQAHVQPPAPSRKRGAYLPFYYPLYVIVSLS